MNTTPRLQWTVTSPATPWNDNCLPNAMTVVLAGVEVHLLSIIKNKYNTGNALLMSTYSALFFFLSAAVSGLVLTNKFGEFRVLASREGDSFQSKRSWVWVMRHFNYLTKHYSPRRSYCGYNVKVSTLESSRDVAGCFSFGGKKLPFDQPGEGLVYCLRCAVFAAAVKEWDTWNGKMPPESLGESLITFKCDARKRELNALPVFTRRALSRYITVTRSAAKGATPLLFVHGWPGSSLEVTKLLPLLTAVSIDHLSFYVVAPSLPGYSCIIHGRKVCLKKGFMRITRAMPRLSTRDTSLNLTFQQVNGLTGPLRICDARRRPGPYVSDRVFHLARARGGSRFPKLLQGWRGLHCRTGHQTGPQTLGFSLADSPVGLLAWIYEKLVAWSDAYPWTDDEVLPWIWFSREGPAASIRIYYEYAHLDKPKRARFPETSVPVGFSFFPKEVGQSEAE
ncbi:hypothetical protein EDB84DRAFT_1437343 [Lactarius hengduanensis]|nr:hypothetical protein EDB84DRAFT_1437343 [Lactarius hengduanensis]